MPLQLELCVMHNAIGSEFLSMTSPETNDLFNEIKELNIITADTFRYYINNTETTQQCTDDASHALDNLATATISKNETMEQLVNTKN